jgi:predicted Fe-Mo cluster-binding NifX family protein
VSTHHLPARIGDLPPIGRPATGALLEAGITTLAQVATHRRRDLLALHGVGPRAVSILATALAEQGLAFAD